MLSNPSKEHTERRALGTFVSEDPAPAHTTEEGRLSMESEEGGAGNLWTQIPILTAPAPCETEGFLRVFEHQVLPG